jgi:hypothetical protein
MRCFITRFIIKVSILSNLMSFETPGGNPPPISISRETSLRFRAQILTAILTATGCIFLSLPVSLRACLVRDRVNLLLLWRRQAAFGLFLGQLPRLAKRFYHKTYQIGPPRAPEPTKVFNLPLPNTPLDAKALSNGLLLCSTLATLGLDSFLDCCVVLGN